MPTGIENSALFHSTTFFCHRKQSSCHWSTLGINLHKSAKNGEKSLSAEAKNNQKVLKGENSAQKTQNRSLKRKKDRKRQSLIISTVDTHLRASSSTEVGVLSDKGSLMRAGCLSSRYSSYSWRWRPVLLKSEPSSTTYLLRRTGLSSYVSEWPPGQVWLSLFINT